MIKTYPSRFEAYQVLGEMYGKALGWPFSYGDKKKGVEIMEQGRSYAGRDGEYLLQLGQAYILAERMPEATVTLRDCIDEGLARADLEWEMIFLKERAQEILDGIR